MASKIDVTYFRLRAVQPDYRRRESSTLRWLETRLDATCYLCWSAGKDSMVMAHLCRRVKADLPILCSDTGVPYRWSADDRERFLAWTAEQGWDVRYFPWDKWGNSAIVTATDDKAYRAASHAGQFDALNAWAIEHGHTRRVDGMRMEESRTRKILLAKGRGETNSGLHPLWQWSTDDIWTYTVAHVLPWLSIYDHLGPHARNGLIGKNGREHGRLVYLKRYYPQAFKRACELFGARDYV